jgi:hypothetical protein
MDRDGKVEGVAHLCFQSADPVAVDRRRPVGEGGMWRDAPCLAGIVLGTPRLDAFADDSGDDGDEDAPSLC